MTLRIAIASEDGRFVQQHFGRARQFLICEINGDDAEIVEVRSHTPPCGTAMDWEDHGHSEDRMQQSVALVADCDAVLVARIGPGAVESLAERGIRAFIIPDRIEAALNRVVASGLLVDRGAPAAAGTPS